ncbi:FAD-binding oxidoreductase [Pedobacter nyackensis]|uniref:FAD-binding oxidoreductase n=1 Tax=Pedobacter nyackensis TaxID=475255 RepID=UPI00292E3106|nr:FAD-binding oxidoreductase [Pedobacter nyackensis]
MRVNARKIIWFSLLGLLLFALSPVFFLVSVYVKEKKIPIEKKSSLIRDASNLNEVMVDTVVQVANNITEGTLQIQELIKIASEQRKSISIAGARHSMGGHTIYKDGIVLDMKSFNYMKLDTTNNLLLVGAGALWSDVLRYLDKYNRSVKVMQSNNSFSVGGSVSVNCHGWQANSPPIASTVMSFRLMDAGGQILTCSRTENAELFSLVLGGYGLFGVILDLKLKVTDNKVYVVKQYVVQSKDYFNAFKRYVENGSNVEMAYGRININPRHFMEEAILSTYTVKGGVLKENADQFSFVALRRTLFRGSVNSDYGKDLRWRIEKMATKAINGKEFSRNRLLSEGVEVFQNRDSNYTDILHEYFVPGDSLAGFIGAVQKIIPDFKVDLLNITVRNVMTDKDTFLSYAKKDVFGLVMLFNQKRDKTAEYEMKALTQKLIVTVIRYNGTYYLPYRLHATKELMDRAYPNAESFFELKLKYDPLLVFRNQFYEKYKR